MPTTQTFAEVEAGNIRPDVTQQGDRGNWADKAQLTREFIAECLSVSATPVCLCSFGKDSLVLLHIINSIKKIPVIFLREPFFQSKFRHAQRVSELWKLTVYDYPPSACEYVQIDDYFDVYNFYYVDGRDFINLYTGTRDRKETDKEYLCAVKDLLLRPKVPAYDFNFDFIFHGMKSIDPVYIAEPQTLPLVVKFGHGFMGYPLTDWSNEDIWAYIKHYDLPFNEDRYTLKKEEFNNDLYPTCHDCIDYRNAKKEIICPQTSKLMAFQGKTEQQHEEFLNVIKQKMVHTGEG